MKKLIRRILLIALLYLGIYLCLILTDRENVSVQHTCHQTEEFYFCEITNGVNENSPLVILQHGLDGSKEDMNDWAEHLARSGYTVVILDAAGHGSNASEYVLDLPDIIKVTSGWYDEILGYYRDNGTAKEDNFAITGISMGGMIALYYGAYGKNEPKCIISLYSAYDWNELTQVEEAHLMMKAGKRLPITDVSEQNEICRKLKEYSPANDTNSLLQVPILMINGDCDPIMPVPNTSDFEGKANGQYCLPKIIIRRGQGHKLAEGDSEESLHFLTHYLPAN